MNIQQGDFVEARGRPWLVEAVDDQEPGLTTVRLSSISDDAQGEQIEVLWDAEVGASVLATDTWSHVGRGAPDDPKVLAAHLRAIRWRSATAADRDLLQAPFRAAERRAIPTGTRIRIESRANGYRVSWRDPTGRRRAARWTGHDLDLYRSRALRSYLEAV